VGTVAIGSSELTGTLGVTLAISATDASGTDYMQMCVSNGNTCAAWIPYATRLPWTLAAGSSGMRTVSVWFRDVWGNTSTAPVRDTIVYDVSGPTGGSIAATASAGQIALAWSGFADPAGVASYRLVAAAGTKAPATCGAGQLLASGADTAFTHTGLAAGATWSYRVCGADTLGNVGAGVVKTVKAP
jgi:hypothetical protein